MEISECSYEAIYLKMGILWPLWKFRLVREKEINSGDLLINALRSFVIDSKLIAIIFDRWQCSIPRSWRRARREIVDSMCTIRA
jgi:hypothetical protein